MSKNDITGDEIRTKPFSQEYENNYDKIFRKFKCNGSCGEYECREHQNECIRIPSRIDIIGQNGNDGLHYEQTVEVVGKLINGA